MCYNQKEGEFVFRRGPVFSNIILADEINRATPRTQSALLECMEEHQVTVDGEYSKLEEPFVVIATQNPIETAGTYQLPEAQLDRFLMKINMGYPKKDDEVLILNRFLKEDPSKELSTVATCEDIVAMKEDVKNVYVHPVLIDYIVELARMTRQEDNVSIRCKPERNSWYAQCGESICVYCRQRLCCTRGHQDTCTCSMGTQNCVTDRLHEYG